MTGRAAALPRRSAQREGPLARPVQGLALLAGLVLGLPVVVLVVKAILSGTLVATASIRVVVDGLALSLLTTAVSLVLTVVLGTPLALLLARRRFRGSMILETLIDLPIVLPPSVAGLALLLVLGRNGVLGDPLGALGISLPFTTIAVIVAQCFVSAPFFIRSARVGFASVDHDLEDAARVDGASELAVFTRVTLPLASSALAAGLVMSWARSLGEFGATIMFAGNVEGQTQTLPLVVYGSFQGGDLQGSIAAAAILAMAAFGVLVAVRALHWGRALDTRWLG